VFIMILMTHVAILLLFRLKLSVSGSILSFVDVQVLQDASLLLSTFTYMLIET
jgi:hypothetical protein